MDEQLFWLRSLDTLDLDNLDDMLFDTLQSAWPEGFDEVIFGLPAYDEKYANYLVEAYLEAADKMGFPLETEFGAAQEEMEQMLRQDFVTFIRQWREAVLLWLEKRSFSARNEAALPAPGTFQKVCGINRPPCLKPQRSQLAPRRHLAPFC
jgi:hypothetical protein